MKCSFAGGFLELDGNEWWPAALGGLQVPGGVQHALPGGVPERLVHPLASDRSSGTIRHVRRRYHQLWPSRAPIGFVESVLGGAASRALVLGGPQARDEWTSEQNTSEEKLNSENQSMML
jgi:hypothetical protein